MRSLKQPRLRTSNSSRPRWRAWLCAATACLPMTAFGYCLSDRDPEIRQLQELVGKNAGAAVRRSQELLSLTQSSARTGVPAGGVGAAVSRMASLYAVMADAQGILELDSEARRQRRQRAWRSWPTPAIPCMWSCGSPKWGACTTVPGSPRR